METKANYLLIGGFVIGVALFAFGFVYWMQNYGTGGGARSYYIVFEGSVSGLRSGSKVLFNGLTVGKVDALALDRQDARKVRVTISVAGDTPVRKNSRARIEQQGLTGGSIVQLTAGTPDAALLTASADGDIPTIEADRATSASLFEAAPEVIGNANALLVRLNDVVADNQDSLRNVVTNIESFSTMLGERKDDISTVIVDARKLTERLNKTADKIDSTVDDFRKYVSTDGDSFMVQAQQAAKQFRELAQKLNTTVGDNVDGLTHFAKDGLQQFELFMRDGRRAAQNLDRVLERIERNPQSFLFGGSQVPEYTPSH